MNTKELYRRNRAGRREHVILRGTLHGGGESGLKPCFRGTYQMEHGDGTQDFGTFDVDRIVA